MRNKHFKFLHFLRRLRWAEDFGRARKETCEAGRSRQPRGSSPTYDYIGAYTASMVFELQEACHPDFSHGNIIKSITHGIIFCALDTFCNIVVCSPVQHDTIWGVLCNKRTYLKGLWRLCGLSDLRMQKKFGHYVTTQIQYVRVQTSLNGTVPT